MMTINIQYNPIHSFGGNSITDIGAENMLQLVHARAKSTAQNGQTTRAASATIHLRSKLKSSVHATRTRTTAGKSALLGQALGLTLQTLL